MALQKAITAELLELEVCGGVAVRCYAGGVSPGPDSPRPLLLLHSINAAPSAMEMKPLFEHLAPQRPVFAPDLPGFGLSQRGDLPYSSDFYAQAIADVINRCSASRSWHAVAMFQSKPSKLKPSNCLNF